MKNTLAALLLLLVSVTTLTQQALAAGETIDQLTTGTTPSGAEYGPFFQTANPAVKLQLSAIISALVGISGGCGNTAIGGAIAVGTISSQVVLTTLTGSNAAVSTSTCGGLVNFNNAGGQVPTIAEAGTTGFPAGWYADLCNIGAGNQVLTPASPGTIGGNASYTLNGGTASSPVCARIVSDGVSDYKILGFGGSVTPGSITTFTNKTLTDSSNKLGGVTMTLGSDATGDIYFNSSGVLTRLAIGSTNQCTIVTAGAPAWGACSLLNVADQTVSGGAFVTSLSLGTVTTGTTTIDCGGRPNQYFTNGGASTFAAPTHDGSCVVLMTNNGSAGTITFSGFTVGASTGDALTTSNGNKFSIFVWRTNGVAAYTVTAHQ